MRPLQLSDAPFIVELFNTPGWLKYIGDRNIHSVADAERFLKKGALHFFKEYGWGTYLITHQESGLPVGTCGLYQRDELNAPDYGFAIMPAFEGQGIAYEATDTLLQYYRKLLDLPTIYAISQDDNVRSHRLLARLNFEKEGKAIVNGDEFTLFQLNTIKKEEEK